MISEALAIGGSLLQGITGFSSGKKAAKRRKMIGEIQAKEYESQAEKERVLGIEQEKSLLDTFKQQREMVSGMYAKSGLLLTGTPAATLEEQKGDAAYNIDQHRQASESRVESLQRQAFLARLGAQSDAAGYRARGAGDLMSGIFKAAPAVAGLFDNWLGNDKQGVEDSGIDWEDLFNGLK